MTQGPTLPWKAPRRLLDAGGQRYDSLTTVAARSPTRSIRCRTGRRASTECAERSRTDDSPRLTQRDRPAGGATVSRQAADFRLDHLAGRTRFGDQGPADSGERNFGASSPARSRLPRERPGVDVHEAAARRALSERPEKVRGPVWLLADAHSKLEVDRRRRSADGRFEPVASALNLEAHVRRWACYTDAEAKVIATHAGATPTSLISMHVVHAPTAG